jgi:hypothetical protein
MRIALLTIVFVLGVTATAQARLGENADELVARYGQPLKETDQKSEGIKVAAADVTFQKGGFEVSVTMVDGISAAESFKKINGEVLTIGEVRTLLSANSQGHGWEAPQTVDGQKIWLRDDSATAGLSQDGVSLLIKSKELIGAQAAAAKAEKTPSLDGF